MFHGEEKALYIQRKVSFSCKETSLSPLSPARSCQVHMPCLHVRYRIFLHVAKTPESIPLKIWGFLIR